MKKLFAPILAAALGLSAGCSTPVNVSGSYATPKQTISGDVSAATNGLTVSGAYATTNQTIGGSVSVGK